jgi:hypothetical protein
MLQKELLTKDYAAIGEEISHETAAEFRKSYEQSHPTEARGYALGRNIIDQILAQPGCVGMRFYYGMNEVGQKTLVYVGVDADGKDIVKRTVVTETGNVITQEATVADRLVVIWPW